MRNKRFVLDPNIYISYFISRNQNTLAALAIKHKLEFVVCDELIAEFRRVLGYPRLAKFKIDIKQAVNYVMTLGTCYTLTHPIRRYIPQDENDDYLIGLALKHLRVILLREMTISYPRRRIWKGSIRS